MIKFFNQLIKIIAPAWIKTLLFFALTGFLIFYLGLFEERFFYPQGLHIWRQSDGFAQIMNYFYNDLNIFDWGLAFNQFDNGARGVGEFPIHYIIQAVLFKIFGVNYWLPQIYSTLLTITGLYCLYRAAAMIIKDHWAALLLPFVYFFSPLFIAYCFRIMPDAHALATFHIGFFFFVKYYYAQKNKDLAIGLVFISLTGMVKFFFLTPYIAFYLVVLFDKLFHKNFKFSNRSIIFMALPIVLTLAWIACVYSYNNYHDFERFLNRILPLWEVSGADQSMILERILQDWRYQFFNDILFKLTIFIGIISIIAAFYNRYYKFLLFIAFYALGLLFLDTLFFRQLYNHDYYFLIHLPLIIALWIIFFYSVSQIFSGNFMLKLSAAVLFIFMIFQFETIERQISWRYDTWRNEAVKFKPIIDHQSEIKAATKDAKIIVPDDDSYNFLLSILRKQGWSGFQINYQKLSLEHLKNRGAKYVVTYKESLQDLQRMSDLKIKQDTSFDKVDIYLLTE